MSSEYVIPPITENEFERAAQRILQYLRADLRYGGTIPRPFFIELTGSPSSGKTTTITELDKFLRRQGFRVLRPQEGAEQIRHITRDTPLYNVRTGLYALEMLVDFSAGHLYDVVIFDRAIFDAYCWMMYWESKSKLSPEERRLIQDFFLFRLWAEKIDIAYFMVCDPHAAMEREMRLALSAKLGETTNPHSIEVLVERYRTAFAHLSAQFPQLRLVDTTQMGEHEMVEHIARMTLAALDEKARGSALIP